MLRSSIAAMLAVVALGLVACGSDDGVGDRVPKSTPDLTVPGGDALAAGSQSGGTGTTSTDATTTPGATTAAGTGAAAPAPAQGAPAQTTPQGAGTGGAAPQQQQPAQPDAGATGGASLEDFCADNPGACPGN